MDRKLIFTCIFLLGCGVDVLLCILSLALPRWQTSVFAYIGLWKMCFDHPFVGSDCANIDGEVDVPCK